MISFLTTIIELVVMFFISVGVFSLLDVAKKCSDKRVNKKYREYEEDLRRRGLK